MSSWTREEAQRVGDADELEIASLREDGSLRKFVIIWVVRLGDDVYVRSVKGRESWWFTGVQTRHEGRIKAGGVEKDVAFVEVGRERDAEIDAAYRAKYSYSPTSVAHINDPKAQAATIKLVPR
ncbi:MAG: DUF2255 family protein [Anaerolineales bacterium]|nr:DUF2255 family protein [Anaerolineales bacterium]